jgi:hypothetical protein
MGLELTISKDKVTVIDRVLDLLAFILKLHPKRLSINAYFYTLSGRLTNKYISISPSEKQISLR